MLERCVSRVFVLVVFLVAAAGFALAQDDWLGGTGNWSNGALWSGGVPVPADNVLIYSGGNDNVTLDVNATIDSLTLGGASNGTTSELTDGGVAHTLNITTSLTVGQTGVLYLYGGSTVTANADSSNAGAIVLYNGSTVSITGNLDNQRAAYTGGGGSQ